MGMLESMASAMGMQANPSGSHPEQRDITDSRAHQLISQTLQGGVGGLEQYGLPLPQDYEKFLHVYPQSVWVYACVWIISTNASGVPLHVVDGRGEEGAQRFEIPGLEFPNEFMTFPDLAEATFVSLELIGNGYWEIVGDELFWMRPDKVRIVPDGRKFIKGYRMYINNKEERFEPEDVIHFKYFNPLDPFYGLATLSAVRLSVDSDYDGRKLYRRFFENAAIPAAVLETEFPSIQDTTVRQVREQIRNLYVGLDKAFEPMILPSGLKWRDVQVSPHDLSISQFNEMSRMEILGAFRVPPILVGLETQNYATAREQKFTFWQSKILPIHSKFRSTIDLQYLRRVFGGGTDVGLRSKYDYSAVSALQDPWKELGEFITNLKKHGIISANEARVVVNTFVTATDFDEFDGGDSIYEPMNIVPVGESPPNKGIASDTGRTKLQDVLSKCKRYVGREEANLRKKLIQQVYEAEKMAHQMEQASDVADKDLPFCMTPDYDALYEEKHFKWREKRAKNPTIFTRAGSVSLYQRRYSGKYYWNGQ